MLRGLATVSFFADSLADARTWYTELLGIEPYYQFPHDGPPAYIEYRIGDYEHELGFIDRKYAPHKATEPAGSVTFWHVDDIEDALRRLVDHGATVHDPITPREAGFVTASVIDPFGNILGIMYNPHYVDIRGAHTAQSGD
ncbi:VOC family protein [Kibdelosporangium aridum]|uniref:VOC family protein n=1 Tax=Kibdelosporangium aridum TaxID=2030 RepID=A0A428YRA2_KIBAR|nr:VOC family protein [Kibdelosporangium aridum]RSM71616.1 VOC family protein [Kibdelosporangium aridum]